MDETARTPSITIQLPDGSSRELSTGSTGLDLATTISEGLARVSVGVEIDGEVRDLRQTLTSGDAVRIITTRDAEALAVLRHSTAHIMAEAVTNLYPGTKFAIGPAIENGFYYDFLLPEGQVIREDDLPTIEAEMQRLIREGRSWERWEVSRDEALQHFREEDEPFKVELIEDLPPDTTLTFYRQGDFTDLCRGPHIQQTKNTLKAIKLMSVAGAYWRGDAKREQLTRIYGTAFFSKADLDAHLEMLEKARANDHRLLGKQLGLFSQHDISPGAVFWGKRGMVIWNAIVDLWQEQHRARGYGEVRTPILYDADLWKRSGHWDVYRENMYFVDIEDRQFGLKPMNCPAHCTMVGEERHSWRDLPLRLCEQGLVHRYEPSGTLHGLMRVRQFTQDDAHIFCTPEQVLDEVTGVLQFVLELYRIFGFEDYAMELSTRPAKAIGATEVWDKAEAALAEALVRNDIPYTLNPGDGAFYGPKIDFHIRDSIGRSWQCGTVQLDFMMPDAEHFDLVYTGEDNADHPMVMIHRALLGSMERFIGILIEHYGGEFPLWLAPVQATVVPVAQDYNGYAHDVKAQLQALGIRADVDDRNEKLGRKVRDAEQLRTPLVLVVGRSEMDDATVNVRRRGVDEQQVRPVTELVHELAREIAARDLGPVHAAAGASED